MGLKRKAGDGSHILFMTEHCKKLLIQDASQVSFTVSPGWFTEALVPSQSREVSLDSVKNQEEERVRLRTICEALSEEESRSFTVAQVVEKGASKELIEKWVAHWKQEGTIMEPKLGEYRFV